MSKHLSSTDLKEVAAVAASSTADIPSKPADLLSLPDDVILIIANMCADGGSATESVPQFSHIHRRFAGVIGDDFWKQWCRSRGYAIPSSEHWDTVNYRMLSGLIDEWARGPRAWEQNPWDTLSPRARNQHWGAIVPPNHITSSNTLLSWVIEEEILVASLRALYEEINWEREISNKEDIGEVDVMTGLCLVERKIWGGPYLEIKGDHLSLEACRLVTHPAVTGLAISLEVYEPPVTNLDYTVMVTNGSGVTLFDVLFAIGKWLSKSLTPEQQHALWEEQQVEANDNNPTKFSKSSKYEAPLDASRTTKQAIMEQFMADHVLRLDLGRELINGGYYQCTAVTTTGSIVVRLT